ncbi:MAG: SDR family oxidoreductase [Gammaproteobacteria bacterium]
MKNIVVTGASKGIGQAIVNTLHKDNYKLILIASSLESFKERNPDITYIAADFTSSDDIDAAAESISKQFDHIDVLINNVGTYLGKPLADTELQEMRHLMDVNFAGPAHFTKRMLPLLSRGKHAQIINISSVAAKKHMAEMAAYAASKAAVTWFANSLRFELNQQGIRVTVLHPNSVNTWNDPHPELLLDPNNIANTVKFIIESDPKCQIEEMTITPVKSVD